MVEKSLQNSRGSASSQVSAGADPLLAAWAKTLARFGERPAIYDAQRRVILRFREVEELSREYESGATLTNLAAGEILAIQIGNHPHWPSLFLACLRRKIVVLPLEQTMSAAERARALDACRVNALCIDPAILIERFETNHRVNWNDHQPVLLKLTSGTTGTPRAIRFRGAQLLADAEQICDTMGFSPNDLNFAVIPISHSYGFSNLITPLLGRGIPMALSNDRLPRAVLADLARTEATIFPGMPLFYQAFNEMKETPPLPKLRLCISAGAPLIQNVARAFREKFGLAIHSFYGASECGGICYDREATGARAGFVGMPMQGVTLQQLDVDPSATQVRVVSAAVGDGYFPEPEPAKLGSVFFQPDDLLAIDESGVRIVGRLSDVINVAGKKVHPAEVEAQLLRHPAVRQAVVFGRAAGFRNEEVVACVVAVAESDEAQLLAFCRDNLSGWQVPKRIFLLDALPVNERGKISRRELARRFAS